MEKRKERTQKNRIFPRELIRKCLKENNLKDGKSIEDFLKASFGEFIQEALEAEMDEALGYGKYDSSSKSVDNSRNGYLKKQ